MTTDITPADHQTIVHLLRARAAAHPKRIAFTFLKDGGDGAADLTYAELDQAARLIAARLQQAELGGNPHALLLFPPGLDFIKAFFGCLYAGVAAVPAYPPRSRRTHPRLRAIAADSRPAAVLTNSLIAPAKPLLDQEIPELHQARWLVVDDSSDSEEVSADQWREPQLSADSLCFLQYTSGSTSLPKGVMVSHGNLMHNEQMIQAAFDQDERSVVVGWLPLYHDMGLIGNVLQPLYVGARCVLMSPVAFLQQPFRWLHAISHYKATTSGGPNFAYDLCVRKISAEQRQSLDLSHWKVAYNGAEPVRAETMTQFAETFADQGFRREAFFPCYGLAEATLFVSGGGADTAPVVGRFQVEALGRHQGVPAQGDEEARALVGCGRAWLEQDLRIVDPEKLTTCGERQVGEIWVAGPSVAGGYLGKDEETARDFGVKPSDAPNSPQGFLRTGDLGFLHQGELFVTGRIKDLIIIRGRNHYPQDIELSAEKVHPDLKPGCGAAFSVNDEGGERLVIVQEIRRRPSRDDAPQVIAEAVRRGVAEDHEVQVYEVVLIKEGSLAKTSSGKVQRRATKAAYLAGQLDSIWAGRLEQADNGEVAAMTLSREVLFAAPEGERLALLGDYLRQQAASAANVAVAGLDPDQPLTSLGFDSLMSIELKSVLETELGAAPELARLLEGASINELAAELLADLSKQATAKRDVIGQAPEAEFYPLSYGQRALWFLQRLIPDTIAFTLVGAAKIEEKLDVDALKRVLAVIVARHPSLRTTFRNVNGEPRQRIHESMSPAVYEVDASELSEAALRERIETDAYAPFDLAAGPLLRMCVYHHGTGQAVFLAVHHLVSDLWSLAVLLRELEALYKQETGGPAAELEPINLGYVDYVHWQNQLLAGEQGQALWDYWRERLGGDLTTLDLPTDFPRPAVQTARGAFETNRLEPALISRLEQVARGENATLYMLLLATFQVLMARYSGQDDIVLGSPTTGRGPAALDGMMGYFINPVVMRGDLSGRPSFKSLLAQTRAAVLGAFRHQNFPFPLLAERLQPERDPSRSPIFQVFFVMEQARLMHERGLSGFALGNQDARLRLLERDFQSLQLERRGSQFDLMMLMARLEGGLGMTLEYNPDLFRADRIRRMLGHFETLLRGVADGVETVVWSLPLLTDGELNRLLHDFNHRAEAVPYDGVCLHRRIEDQAARDPNATAAVFEVDELSYGLLNTQANRLAHLLREFGVREETPVALCMPRSLELIVGALGILKAGGVYVPVDPGYPLERQAYLFEDAFQGEADPVILSHSSFKGSLPAPAGSMLLYLDEMAEALTDESSENPDYAPDAANTAYVIYTSGSTGKPKGVCVSHGNAVRLFDNTRAWFQFGPEDVWTLFHSYAFDFSVWELWGPLTTGGQVIVVPKEVTVSPEAFLELLETEAVTVLNQTPSAFAQLVKADGERDRSLALRFVVFGGEALDFESLAPWMAKHGDTQPQLINMYGITETTVHVTWRRVVKADLQGSTSLIGQPIPDLSLYVLDGFGGPAPLGVPGEIHVGGAGPARGYLGRPDLTAERFVPDPFSGTAGARLYRTGDLARYEVDGDLAYLGRIDHQVKIRGFRIELGEIEATLAKHEAVAQVLVVADRDHSGDPRLIAYVVETDGVSVPADDEGGNVREMRRFLKEQLPEYMVPAHFVVLPAFPLTSSGKVDTRALPAPESARLGAGDRVAPRGPVERRLADVWREVLGVAEVSVHDDFFESGGHSLKATELLTKVSASFGVELPLRYLFEAPTVAGLAEKIEALRGTDAAEAVVYPDLILDPERRFEPFPLTDIQQAYWIGRSSEFALGTVSTQSYMEIASRDLDLPRLEASWRVIINRHDMLRAVIGADGRQTVLREAPPYEIVVRDLSGASPEAIEAGLNEVRDQMAHNILPADRWPLFEIRATLLPDGLTHLHARLDALIYDAWSAHLLLREWMTLYNDGEAAAELPPVSITFRDYVYTLRAFQKSESYQRAKAYWVGRLPDMPSAPDLPLACQPERVTSHRFARRNFRMPPEVWDKLKARAGKVGVGPSALLLAAYSQVLAMWSKNPRLTVNLTLFQRLPFHPDVNQIVGDFTSLILVGADTADADHFEGFAREVQARMWRDMDHSVMSGVEVLRELSRYHGGQPVAMPVVFTSTLGLDEEVDLSMLPGDVVHSITQTSQVWLDQQVSEEQGTLVSNWDAVEQLFPAGLLDIMFETYRRLLDGLLAGEDYWHLSLPELRARLLPPDQAALRAAVNDTGAPVSDALMHELFFERAEAEPQATAVIYPGGVMAYGELARRVHRIANRLRREGARPNGLIGVVMEKGWEQPAATLAINEAGGAYLPIDAAMPKERLDHLLERGEAAIVLTQQRFAGSLVWPDGIRVFAVDGADFDGESETALSSIQKPEDLAYVIFTSGSTGQPKGVAIDHRGAVNTLLDINKRFEVGPDDRVLGLSSLSFDLSVYDIFGMLAAGGSLLLPDPAYLRDPAHWTDLVEREGITLWNTVPPLFQIWVEYLEARSERRPKGPRLALLSGDWIPTTLPDRARVLFPEIHLISLGGATEASIWSILYPIGEVPADWSSVPYGKPMVNQTFHVLDDGFAPRPVWVAGNLYIGGIGLAKYYWRDEEKTAASFIINPLTGERLYRTGDMGRYLPDGNIEFLGREDFQVKIQGYRVELGEIEAALMRHELVREAVVIAAGDPRGARRLVAYVIPRDAFDDRSSAGLSEQLRQALRAQLPQYMAPGSFVFLEAFPLTANGKLNRAALPAPAAEKVAVESPAASVESKPGVSGDGITARITEMTLGVLEEGLGQMTHLDPETNLLELGATSLEVIRLANHLEEEFGARPSVQDFYHEPTVAALARFYQGMSGEGGADQTVTDSSAVVDPGMHFEMILDPGEREAFKKREPSRRPVDEARALALPDTGWDEKLGALYRERMTHRIYRREAMPLTQLSGLLSCLRRLEVGDEAEKKPKYLYPSAGALYPVQNYLHVKAGRVEGLAGGTYYYDPVAHRLMPLTLGVELDAGIHDPFVNMPIFEECAFSLFFVADLSAIGPIYGENSLTFSLQEAGYMGQLLMMHAPREDVGLCTIGVVDFDRVRDLFALEDHHVLVHLMLGGAIDHDRESAPFRLQEAHSWNITFEGDMEMGEL